MARALTYWSIASDFFRHFIAWQRRHWLFVAAPMALISLFILIRDGLLSPEYRNLYLLQFLPPFRWYWHWYGIAFLTYCMILFIITTPAVVREMLNEERKRGRERLLRYQQMRRSLSHSQPSPRPSLTSLEDIEKNFELKRLEPNIIHQEAKVVDVYEGAGGIIVEGQTEGAHSFVAVVLLYHNAPDSKRKISEVADVSARLDYSFFEGTSRFTVPRGVWLSRKHDKVYFGKNDRLQLILATHEKGQLYAVSREFDDANPEGITRRRKIPELKSAVRIILATESEMKNINQLTVMLETENQPVFSARVEKLKTWKVGHLHSFVDEGLTFSKRLHEIWEDARKQVPLPKSDTGNLLGFSVFRPRDTFDWSAALARIRAIEREEEEKLLGEIREWEARAAAWLKQFIGVEAGDKLLSREPSIEAGFERERKSRRGYRILAGALSNEKRPSPESPEWSLSDAVSARTDVLFKTIEKLL